MKYASSWDNPFAFDVPIGASGSANTTPDYSLACRNARALHCIIVVGRTWTRWYPQSDQTGRPSWRTWQTSTDILKLILGASIDTGNCLQMSVGMQIVVSFMLFVHYVYRQLTGRLYSVLFWQRIYLHVICTNSYYIMYCFCMLFYNLIGSTFCHTVMKLNYKSAK